MSSIFPAQGETISLSQETKSQFEQSTILEGQNPFLLSQTRQEGLDFQLDDKHQLSLEVPQQDPIDWDNTKIEIGVSFELDF